MNTTTTADAAAQAHVTVATIRTWCRTGVVTATKQAGRWIINTASLAHRIAIATWRTRKAPAMTQPKPSFTPHTRAEFLHYDGETVVRVMHYADKHSFGTRLFLHKFPYREAIDGGFRLDFNDAAQAACERALNAAGWTITSDWTQNRNKTLAAVRAI